MTSKQKGILTELLCITELSSIGCTISTPYGDNARYDMIADYKHNLIRIQCKTARKVQDGVYRVHNRSAHCNMTRVLNIRYTKEDADFIGTYFDKKMLPNSHRWFRCGNYFTNKENKESSIYRR